MKIKNTVLSLYFYNLFAALRLVSVRQCSATWKLVHRWVHLCYFGKNATALSHLGKQVIAISIMYNDMQRWTPKSVLSNTVTEINASTYCLFKNFFFFNSLKENLICITIHGVRYIQEQYHFNWNDLIWLESERNNSKCNGCHISHVCEHVKTSK